MGVGNMLLQAPSAFLTSTSFSHEEYLRLFKGWTYACMQERGNGVASLEWMGYRVNALKGQRTKEELPFDSWIPSLLSEPNPEVTQQDTWSLILYWLDLTGNCFLYTPTWGGALPQEMWVLPSTRVQIIPGRPEDGKLVKSYRFYANGGTWDIDEREICHFKHVSPSSDFHRQSFQGVSVVERALDEILIDESTRRFLRKHFENDALPAFVITEPAGPQNLGLTDQQFNQFRQRWNETFMGANKKGRWGYLDGGKSIQVLDNSQAKRELQQIAIVNRDIICSVFGVPETLLTRRDDNYASAVTHERSFYKRTLAPLARRIGQELTRHFRGFEQGILVEHKDKNFSTPEEDLAEQRHRIFVLGETPNTILQELGRDTIGPIGDKSVIESGAVSRESIVNAPAPDAETPNAESPKTGDKPSTESEMESKFGVEAGTGSEGKSAAKTQACDSGLFVQDAPEFTKSGVYALRRVPKRGTGESFILSDGKSTAEADTDLYRDWKRYDAPARESEVLIKRGVQRAFRELQGDVLRSAEKAIAVYRTKQQVSDTTPILFDEQAFKALLERYTSKDVASLLEGSYRRAIADVGEKWQDVESDFDRKRGKALESSLEKITTASGTAKKELSALVQGMKDRPISEVMAEIGRRFEFYTTYGAERIARTSATHTSGSGQLLAWKGKWEYVWLSMRDGDTRDTHAEADGRPPDKEGLFT